MYFPEDTGAHQSDPVINMIEPKRRRLTLLASSLTPENPDTQLQKYSFDIVIQGNDETVFFDI